MTQLHKLSPVAATIGTIQQFPALRGFWPMSAQNYTGSVLDYADYSGNGYPMVSASHTRTQAALHEENEHFVPFVDLTGTTNGFIYRVDHAQWDITGTEGWVHSAQRGMTMGCWWHSDITPVASAGIMSKYWTSSSQRSYLLYLNAATPYPPVGLVSGDGIVNQVVAPTPGLGDLTAGQWAFTVMRFDPSTSLQMFHNGYWSTNVISIPASIFSSTSRLEIGSYNNGNSLLNGGVAMAFICASAVHEQMIENLWGISREMFGI